MTRKRWMQLRHFLLVHWFWEPIWRNNIIFSHRNRLIRKLFTLANERCVLGSTKANTLFGLPIVKVDNLPKSKLVFGDFRAYMEYEIKPRKGKEST